MFSNSEQPLDFGNSRCCEMYDGVAEDGTNCQLKVVQEAKQLDYRIGLQAAVSNLAIGHEGGSESRE